MSCFGIDRSKGMIFLRLTPEDHVNGANTGSLSSTFTAPAPEKANSGRSTPEIIDSPQVSDISVPGSPSVSAISTGTAGSNTPGSDTSNDDVPALDSPETTIDALAKACDTMAKASIEARTYRQPARERNISDQVFNQKPYQDIIPNIENVISNLRAFEKGLHKINTPTAFSDFLFPEVLKILHRVLGRIERQETLPPKIMDAKSVKIDLPEHTFVDTTEAVASMLESIAQVTGGQPDNSNKPKLAFSDEGRQLDRPKKVSLLAIMVEPLRHIYIVDIQTLGAAAFDTSPFHATPGVPHLRGILEASTVSKLFWDCRVLAKALNRDYGIRVAGVVDLQLMDLATTRETKRRKNVWPLGMTVLGRSQFPSVFTKGWISEGDWAQFLLTWGPTHAEDMHNQFDGNFRLYKEMDNQVDKDLYGNDGAADNPNKPAVLRNPDEPIESAWERRPLHDFLVKYCVDNVCVLPQIFNYFVGQELWSEDWAKRVDKITKLRLAEALIEQTERIDEKAAPRSWHTFRQLVVPKREDN